MNNALLQHALDNVWCNPGQDKQYVWKLVSLSPSLAIRNVYPSYYERIPLPTQDEYYHIYQIGKMHPGFLGIPKIVRRWMSLSYLMTNEFLFTDIYTASGIQFPRGHTFIWFSPTGNMLVAVKENRRIQELYHQDLYMRFYSNAFFESPRSNGRKEIIHKQTTVTDVNQLLAFQRELADIVNEKGGYPFYFVNGRFVNNISIVTAGIDDVVEFILDRSIKRMIEFDITEQPTFHSTMDDLNKYLLHPTDETDTIDYADDIDGYMIDPIVNDRFIGVHYHKNNKAWLRMVTHNDYSVPVSRFVDFVNSHQTDPRHQVDPVKWRKDEWTTPVGKKLRLYIRDSGYDRELVPVAPRIQELYLLDDEQILRAMLETDGTVDVWKAANLESSKYVELMGMKAKTIIPIAYNNPGVTTEEKQRLENLVGDAYGYHAAAKVLADTPSKVYTESGQRYADLAYEHQNTSTVFEYDSDGLLIDWHYHNGGTRWVVKSSRCVIIETMAGKGHFRAQNHGGYDPIDITPGFNYRVYVKQKQFGTAVGDWEDITFSDTRHEYGFFDSSASRWLWTKDSSEFEGLIRVDDEFLCYRLRLLKHDGHLRFTLESETTNADGYWGSETVEIPYGQLDVFLNGRQLAETIDYHVRWPEVVISNMEYLDSEDEQYLTVRMSGFSDDIPNRLSKTEVGFVRQGVLSRNKRYDIHTNKIRRIVIDGRYFHKDDVVFDEQMKNYVIDGVRNGAPYFIQTPPVVFRDVYDNDKLAREKDDEIDRQVSNYLTEHFDLQEYNHPNYITRRYQIISVFANKLLNDLVKGWFYPDGIEGNYSRHDIREWCKNYEWLLPYDISNMEYDDFHINVRPHWEETPVSLNAIQYQFYYRALETYLRYPPNLTPYVTIS